MKRKMQPVEAAKEAYSFVDHSHIQITDRREHYIRTDIHRSYNPPSSRSEGGSSSDYGSSGSSGGGFSGGSGKY